MSRDYYEVLGVTPSATFAEIKVAYRKLAQQYHPDVNKEADAEDKFKELQEAYEAVKNLQHAAKGTALDWSHLSANPGHTHPTAAITPRPDQVDMKTLKSAVLTTEGWLVPNR